MGKKYLNKIKITPLKIVRASKGNILRVLQKKELNNWKFAEAYFSKIKYKKVKAWKFHSKMTLNLVVPYGKVKFVFYSARNKIFKIIEIGEKKYSRITVPPKIWFGFKGMSKNESLILNITNITHDKKEILRKKINQIKFNWK